MDKYRVILKSSPDHIVEAHGWNIDSGNRTIAFFLDNGGDDGFVLIAIFNMDQVVGVVQEVD